jgi:hypothetical protein
MYSHDFEGQIKTRRGYSYSDMSIFSLFEHLDYLLQISFVCANGLLSHILPACLQCLRVNAVPKPFTKPASRYFYLQ